jgi:hypothetical protein
MREHKKTMLAGASFVVAIARVNGTRRRARRPRAAR